MTKQADGDNAADYPCECCGADVLECPCVISFEDHKEVCSTHKKEIAYPGDE